MHFNTAFGNSFRYQSDTEEPKASQALISRKNSVTELQFTPQKKGNLPLSQLGAPAPKSNVGLPVGGSGGSSVNIRASQSVNPGSLGPQDNNQGQVQGPSGSAVSDNTSNSAAVVIYS